MLREPEPKYEKASNSDSLELNKCLKETQDMMRHINKLQSLLRKNNIPHEDYFDNE
jgi:hypothetical protein